MATLSQLRHAPRVLRGTTRSFFNSSTVRAEAASVPLNTGVVQPQKRPIGGFRGGIVGFLLGFSLASAYASYYLLDEYKLASNTLQASIGELQSSTQKVSQHIRRIELLEKELKALTESAAGKDDVSRVRAEMKKLYDGLHIEFLDLRSHVWGIQQDLHALSKKEATSVQVSE
ncbi:hypothetical protein Clacol_007553 [Clathrus columnatus]|uniref:Uncharacterized protein n=1 Tax=Clathrus columnatus TaxID=1419009 RepID=A0AAV5AK30_9AGAM|nr:hypothetical protein Clacol_007553 [Clathrus columnatus]